MTLKIQALVFAGERLSEYHLLLKTINTVFTYQKTVTLCHAKHQNVQELNILHRITVFFSTTQRRACEVFTIQLEADDTAAIFLHKF